MAPRETACTMTTVCHPLAYAKHVAAKVVVLCDAISCAKSESVDELCAGFLFVEKAATTWEAAVEAASNAMSALY